jgi:hypothetical protein
MSLLEDVLLQSSLDASVVVDPAEIQFPKCRVPSNTGRWIKSRNPEIPYPRDVLKMWHN